MTTDDSPQLGGQRGDNAPDDNSPMISGSGTKSIAEVKEAYQTGKAEALICTMNPDQQTRFRQEFIRAAVIHVEQMLAGDLRYQAALDFLQAMQQWIDNLPANPPMGEIRSLLRVIAEMEDRPVNGPKKAMDHLQSAFAMGIFPASKHAAYAIAKSVLFLTYANPDNAPFRADSAVALQVLRWHLEVVWAILHNASIPPLALEP
jgi:hypothetical protein